MRLYSKALSTGLTRIKLEDFFLISQFHNFLTPPVGGFINKMLRGLLLIRINYELCTVHIIMPLSTVSNISHAFLKSLDKVHCKKNLQNFCIFFLPNLSETENPYADKGFFGALQRRNFLSFEEGKVFLSLQG
jgi:hypothetical protein